MHKILATAFILALTACYPVHAKIIEEDIILLSGDNAQYAQFDEKGNGYIVYHSTIFGGIVFCEFTRQGDKLVRKCIDEN
mgnify:CR=1 FL=1